MGDSIELTLDYPIPDADWDKIMDVEFENTKSISFRTKSGKTVEFVKVSEEFEWCTGCKEYDAERHCCPRWNKVIRNTLEELKQERPKGKWINAKCSACGNLAPFWPMASTYYHTDYCPHCGAYMGEEPK